MDQDQKKYGLCWHCGRGGGGSGFGILLLVIGLFFIAQDFGWIPTAVSFWPVFLAAVGLYFVVRSR